MEAIPLRTFDDSEEDLDFRGHSDAKMNISKYMLPVRKCRPTAMWRRVRTFLHFFVIVLYVLPLRNDSDTSTNKPSGVIHITLFLFSFTANMWPDSMNWLAVNAPWFAPRNHHLDERVFPIACHSHNDYWRPRPLFTALEYGCTAVEADVWFMPNLELLVGHAERDLTPNRSLSSLYLDPILSILDDANPSAEEVGMYNRPLQSTLESRLHGVFSTAPKTSLILLIDFKTDGATLWHPIYSLLDPFRKKGYLTHFNGSDIVQGPLTIVASGNALLSDVTQNEHYRDIFFDAPLHALQPSPSSHDMDVADETDSIDKRQDTNPDPSDEENEYNLHPSTDPVIYNTPPPHSPYNPTNSFFASTSFKRHIGLPLHSDLTEAQLALLRSHIAQAHAQGLKVRYWGIPNWPIGVRNYLWRVLVREGVDYLSVDDVRAVAKENWGPRKGGWGKKWWF